MPEAFWTETSRSLLLRPSASTMRPVWNAPAALAGEDERDVRQVVAARAVAPALHAEHDRAVVERGLAVAVVDALERGRAAPRTSRRSSGPWCSGPSTSLLCSSVWCAWSTPWLGQRWPLDAPDSVKATTRVRSHSNASLIRAIIWSCTGRELVAVRSSFAVAGRARAGRARRAVPPAPPPSSAASSASRRALDLAPAVDQAVELARVLAVHAEHALGVGDVLQAEVEQALLARERGAQLGCCRSPGWFESLRAEQVDALHQLVVDLPRVLDRLDGVAVLRVAGLRACGTRCSAGRGRRCRRRSARRRRCAGSRTAAPRARAASGSGWRSRCRSTRGRCTRSTSRSLE